MLYKIEHLEYIWALGVIPVSLLLMWMWWKWRQKAMRTVPLHVRESLLPGMSDRLPWVKWLFIALFFAFSAVSLINPKVGTKVEKIKRKGVDIVFALDVSKSMLAEDAVPNRLERSKQVIRGVLDQLASDRVGLVIYAGAAYPQLPITTDYSAARLFLEQVSTDGISSQGTAVAEALELGIEFYDQSLETNRIMFVLSDGEDHEAGLDEVLALARDQNITIHTLGVGTPNGAPIPEKRNGRTTGYKTDSQGQTVLTKLHMATLSTIASETNGDYIPIADTRAAVDAIIQKVESLEKKEIEARVFSDYKDQFQWFLAIAMLFLLIDTLLPARKMKRTFPFMALLALMAATNPAEAQTPESFIRSGNNRYESGDFSGATEEYYRSIDAEKNNPKAWFNLGDAQFEQQSFDMAESSFQRAFDLAEDPELKSKAQHNLGNIYFNQQDYAKALEAYKNSLKLDPSSESTRKNYALTKRLLQQQQQQQQQQNQDEQQDKDENESDSKKNQDQQEDQDSKQDEKQENQNSQDKPEPSKEDSKKPESGDSQSGDPQENEGESDQKQPQPKEGQMSRETAERLLKALENQERKVQEKLAEERILAQPKTREKDW